MRRAGVAVVLAFLAVWSMSRLVAVAAPAPGDPDAGAATPTTDGGVAEVDAPATPEVDELRPPTTPAFSLLGVSPTEIDRPRTPSALAASLASAVGRTVPSGLALEVSPFWMFDQSDLTLAALKRDRVKQLASSLSISAGTNKTEADAMGMTDGFTDLAIGGHVVLVRGWRTCEVKSEPLNQGAFALGFVAIEAEANRVLAECEQTATTEIAACVANPANQAACEVLARDKLAGCDRDVEASVGRQRDALAKSMADTQAALDEELKKKVEECEKVIWTPSGLVATAAGAAAVRFAGDAWDNGDYLRSAAWATVGYEGERATFLALARLNFENINGAGPDVVAIGGRGILHRNSFAASVEGVYNHGLEDLDSGWRLALVGEGKVGGSWLTLSLGKDYDSLGGDAFFSLANLTVTMGDPTIKQE